MAREESSGDWELYDMETDQTELNDVSDLNANLVLELKQKYDEWAADAGVLPWEEVIKLGNN